MVGVIFPRAKKEGLCGEIISILKKDIKGVEIRDGIKGLAENRLVDKTACLSVYMVSQNRLNGIVFME